MNTSRRWHTFDAAKLLIVLFLLAAALFLALRRPGPRPVGQESLVLPAAITATSTADLDLLLTEAPPTTVADQPAAAPTAPAADKQTAVPSPTPAAQAQTGSIDCPNALPPRLVVGKEARVLKILNFRGGPGKDFPVFHVNFPGTLVQIIEGPVCLPHGEDSYYWWKIQEANGATGWSVEGERKGEFYYLEPVK